MSASHVNLSPKAFPSVTVMYPGEFFQHSDWDFYLDSCRESLRRGVFAGDKDKVTVVVKDMLDLFRDVAYKPDLLPTPKISGPTWLVMPGGSV